MNFNLKIGKPWIIGCLAVTLFSCNNSSEKKEEPAKTADTTANAPAPATAPKMTVPFDFMEISHTVKDYGVWKKAFDADSAARNAAGLGFIVLAKQTDNPNDLCITFSAADINKAKAFAADPRLKDVMEKNGVTSKPDIGYWHALRYNPDSKEKNWVIITHKVKDYDTWLKAYDAEGPSTRAANGLVDVVLARGIDDQGMVHIIFDITDMAKAKARINSPELKKIMMAAGVEGVPEIKFYSAVE
ncbi:MAG: hypothetical protein ACKOU7_07385 [Ferruginibacter sp.]